MRCVHRQGVCSASSILLGHCTRWVAQAGAVRNANIGYGLEWRIRGFSTDCLRWQRCSSQPAVGLYEGNIASDRAPSKTARRMGRTTLLQLSDAKRCRSDASAHVGMSRWPILRTFSNSPGKLLNCIPQLRINRASDAPFPQPTTRCSIY